MKYTVEILPSVKKRLKDLDPKYIKKIIDRIDFLEIDPRHQGSLKLAGKRDLYRTRVGKYRIVYEIYDERVLIIVVNVDHRKDVYR